MADKKQVSTIAWPTLRQLQSVNQYDARVPQLVPNKSTTTVALDAPQLGPATSARRPRLRSKWARYSFNPNVIVVDSSTTTTTSTGTTKQAEKVLSTSSNAPLKGSPNRDDNNSNSGRSKVSQLVKTFQLVTTATNRRITNHQQDTNRPSSIQTSGTSSGLDQDDIIMHTILEYRSGKLHQQQSGGTKAKRSLSSSTCSSTASLPASTINTMDKSASASSSSSPYPANRCQPLVPNGNHVISSDKLLYRTASTPHSPANLKSTNNNINYNSVKECLIKLPNGSDLSTTSILIKPAIEQRYDQVIGSNKNNHHHTKNQLLIINNNNNNTAKGTIPDQKTKSVLDSSSTKINSAMIPSRNQDRSSDTKTIHIVMQNGHNNQQQSDSQQEQKKSAAAILSSHQGQNQQHAPFTNRSVAKTVLNGSERVQSTSVTPDPGKPATNGTRDKDHNHNSSALLSKDHCGPVSIENGCPKSGQNKISSNSSSSRVSLTNGSLREMVPITGGSVQGGHNNSSEDEEDDSVGDLGFYLKENNSEPTECLDQVANSEALFGGQRNYLIPEKVICGDTGTVRGMKNRVRAGIATFHQVSDNNKKFHQLEQNKVIVYTTSNGIVRETFQKCLKVKTILSTLLVQFEERDIFKYKAYQRELSERLPSNDITVPQVFLEGYPLGDANVIEQLNENGRLRKILKPYKRPGTHIPCQKCGGYKLLLCNVCNGSKKSNHRNRFTESRPQQLRCGQCDECGLIECDLCGKSDEKSKS